MRDRSGELYFRVNESPDQPGVVGHFIDQDDVVRWEQGFWVKVGAEKSTCQHFTKRDKSGKPVMIPHHPTVLLAMGDRLRVSATHKESKLDAADGVILASGRHPHYLVLESPEQPDTAGLFVEKEDTRPTAAPEP